MREATLQTNIKKFFEQHGMLVIKQVSPPIGIPDLLVCCGGKHLWIEIKTGKGRLSPAQKTCHLMLARKGQTVIICRSVGDAHEGLHLLQSL